MLGASSKTFIVENLMGGGKVLYLNLVETHFEGRIFLYTCLGMEL